MEVLSVPEQQFRFVICVLVSYEWPVSVPFGQVTHGGT